MPLRGEGRGGRSEESESDTDIEGNVTVRKATNVTMSDEMLHALVTTITRSQTEANRGLIDAILNREPMPRTSSPQFKDEAAAAFIRAPPGNMSKCTARFDGASKNADELEAFIDAVEVYRECTNVSDEHALRGLPMLLVGEAAVWWRGVRQTVGTWSDALRRLRGMFGVPRPAYKVFRDIFAAEQRDERADAYICRVRALIAKLPYEVPGVMQVDIIYGTLDRRIRKRLPRDTIKDIEHLINSARGVEESLAEVDITKVKEKVACKSNNNKFDKHSSSSGVAPSGSDTLRDRKQPDVGQDSEGMKRQRPKCTYCKRFGHLVDECLKKSNNSSQLRCYGCGQLGVVRSKCEKCKGTSALDTSAKCNTLEFQSALITHSDNDSSPLVTVDIGGHQGVAILDTGATHSIAGPLLYRLLVADGVKFATMSRTISLADGSVQTRTTLECEVVVSLKGHKVPISFISLPDADTRTLLGRDFITKANILLDLTLGKWSFHSDPANWYSFTTEYDLVESARMELRRIDTSNLLLRPDEGNGLTHDQKVRLNTFLVERAGRFAKEGPPTDYAMHRIKIDKQQEPIASPPYRLSPKKRTILEKELQKLMDADVIEECDSPWAANVVLVNKKDGGVRLCVDYRKLNAVTEPDRYPLPRIEDVLHAAKNTAVMTTCDLRAGYYQVSVEPGDRDKTAFVSPLGCYRFKRMPMGLRNSGATFQRLMDRFKSGRELANVCLLAYLDDVIILSESFEKHLNDLNIVFDRLAMYNLRVNREKSCFARESVKFLGHVIVPGGIKVDPDKTAAVADRAPPTDVKHVKSFVQMESWFRRFVPNFADVARPLTDLLKKGSPWTWTSQQQGAFERLKELLVSAPILRQADEALPFTLKTDSSGYCLGAVLMQGEGPDERPVEYASRLLNGAERNYNTTEREALAVVWAVARFRGYVEGSEVIVKSDHQPLRWLMNLKSPSGRLARWALTLQSINLRIEYTPGRANTVADALSRPPCAEEAECDMGYAEVDVPSRSPQDVRENQLKDAELRKIVEDMESPDDPFRGRSWSDKGFLMSDGILYRYGPDEYDDETACLVVPEHEREKILQEYHDAPTAGHFGAERTLDRVKAKYYWPGMRQYIGAYLKRCVHCQRYKADNRKPAGMLQTPAVNRRFEVVAVDLFGPLPETPDGNKWILILEDTCSRWVELFALQSATGPEVAKTLVGEVFLRYGVPRRVLSDNGVQFVSEVMQQVCHTFGITQSLTPVYHPQANPVERKNRDLKPQLAILVGKDHTTWDVHLPAIRFAMNSAVTSSTGFSPAYLTFGREMRAPADVVADMRAIVDNDNAITNLTPYLQRLANTLSEARDVHERAQARQKRYADDGRSPAPDYSPGDLVLLKTQGSNDAARGQTPKFIPRRDGPYRIKEAASASTYVLERPRDGEVLGRYHVSQLTPFIGDVVPPPVNEKRKRGRPRKIN